ncbi:Crp/Fnr family transcriptional regulator [Chitinophaga lutea]|uniref:Crp/Fnr family transcriptional regulator n=1 Tax=Chitinophaga lutea TaxID=2488634 RepID=A0A3N4PB61_9BACT|nr:Crp/Fnr family transcriptional regulator [Chitinophaga lutea]RPE05355.1 Crp/Fnr family transcriptional regulator [Chitinophaga lutea]
MHDSLISYINRYAGSPLTSQEEELVRTTFTPKRLKKRQYLLQEGDVCKHFCFIVSGAMRQYSVDEKGIEHVIQLGIETWWMGDRESIVMHTPSKYNIDAWENCELLIISYADTIRLLDQVPSIRKMLQMMEERNSIANQKRLNSTISLAADSRYADFVREYPDFLQRFPLHIIASYLGITKETLSRVRKGTIL